MPPKGKNDNRLDGVCVNNEDTNGRRKSHAKQGRWTRVENREGAGFYSNDANDADELPEDIQKVVNDTIKKPQDLFDNQNPLQRILRDVNRTQSLDKTPGIIAVCTNLYAKKVDSCFETVQKLNSDVAKAASAPQKKKKDAENAGSEDEEENGDEDEEPADFVNESNHSGDGDGAANAEDQADGVQARPFQNDQTMMPFDADMTVRHPCALTDNDWTESGDIAMKLERCVNDRALLVGDVARKPEFAFKAVKRAIAAAQTVLKEQKLKRMKTKKGGRKGKDDDDEIAAPSNAPNDKPVFIDSALYYHASSRKRESRFACFDDVAFTDDSRSLVYLHNQWDENYEPRPDLRDDHFGLDESGDLDDITLEPVSLSLEYLQGAYENATSDNHVLEPELVDMLGLDKHDLTRPRDMRTYADVTYEQTSDANKDPDKCLVDHLSIPGEQEHVDSELERVRNEIKRLYSGRVVLPGGPANAQEDEIRRGLNRVPYFAMYENEDDLPFALDQRDYLTEESINTEAAILRKTIFDKLTPEAAEQIGIPKAVHSALRKLGIGEDLTEDLRVLRGAIPDFFIAKQLLESFQSSYSYLERGYSFLAYVVPFRFARYAQQMLASRLYKLDSIDLPPIHSRNQTPAFGTSMTSLSVSAPKKPRLDSTTLINKVMLLFARNLTRLDFGGDTYRDAGSNPITHAVVDVIDSGKDRVAMEAFFEQFKSPNLFWSVVNASGAFINGVNRNKEIEGLEGMPISALKEAEVEIPVVAGAAEEPMEVDDHVDFNVDDGGNVQIELSDTQNQALANLEEQMNADIPPPDNDAVVTKAEEMSQDLFSNGDDNTPVQFFDQYMPEPLEFAPFEPMDEDDAAGNFDADMEAPPPPPAPRIQRPEEDDLLEAIVGDYTIPEKKKKPRKPRPEKVPEYLDNNEDEAHWEGGRRRKIKAAPKTKQRVKKGEAPEYDDTLLFEPRKATQNVTVSRRKTSKQAAQVKKIQRPVLSAFSPKVESFSTFRSDHFIKLNSCGKFDLNNMFVYWQYPSIRDIIDVSLCHYRSHYHHLPFTAPIRVDNDLHYFTRAHRLLRLYENAKAEVLPGGTGKPPYPIWGEPGRKNNTIPVSDEDDPVYEDDGYNDNPVQEEVFFEAPDYGDHNDSGGFRTPPMSPPITRAAPETAGIQDFRGEFNANPPPPEVDDSELMEATQGEEDVSFEFDAGVPYPVAVKEGYEKEGRFYLKRAIRYVLMRENMDYHSVPEYVFGMNAPNMFTDVPDRIAASTPMATKEDNRGFVNETGDLDVVMADNAAPPASVVDDVNEEDEDILPDENDETVQKPFKVRGHHTFKSLLYFLPSVCIGPTVEQLNVRRVFTTLFHMVNENDLFIIGNNNGPVSVCSDFRIVNFEDAPQNNDDF